MGKGRRSHRQRSIVRKPPTPAAHAITRTVQRQSVQQTITSPAPPPDWLAAYEAAHAGAAERILVLCEKQVTHRHDLERQAQAARIRQQEQRHALRSRGQWFGLAVTLAILGVAVFATHGRNSWVACTAIGVIAAVVGLFVYQTRHASPVASAPTEERKEPS